MNGGVRELLAAAVGRLAEAGVDSPRVDAELLLAHCLGIPRARLPTIDAVAADAAACFADAVRRRVNREPLQHIVGVVPFRHALLAVGPGVFVPRPETELLVDAVLPHLRATVAPLAVDLCAGSGALAISIATEVPGARVSAVEDSVDALDWLHRNCEGTGVEVLAYDVRDAQRFRALHGRADAVVCNPPYVPTWVHVQPEVHADPARAVFAGTDGLALMPDVIARAAELLKPGGVVAIEHDDTHRDAVPELIRQHGRFTDIADHDDLTGRPRYVTARRS